MPGTVLVPRILLKWPQPKGSTRLCIPILTWSSLPPFSQGMENSPSYMVLKTLGWSQHPHRSPALCNPHRVKLILPHVTAYMSLASFLQAEHPSSLTCATYITPARPLIIWVTGWEPAPLCPFLSLSMIQSPAAGTAGLRILSSAGTTAALDRT